MTRHEVEFPWDTHVTESFARMKSLLNVSHVHEGRLSGLAENAELTLRYCDEYSDPLGNLHCASGTHQDPSLGARRFCWFEPIAITDDDGNRMALLYIESFDDAPQSVYVVHEGTLQDASMSRAGLGEHSPINVRLNEQGDSVFFFPTFKVRETTLCCILWRFKRKGRNDVPTGLIRRAMDYVL